MNTRATTKLVSLLLAAAALTVAGAAPAATTTTTSSKSTKSTSKSTKSTAKTPAPKPVEPVVAEPVVASTGSHWMTPKAVQLRATTETEAQANAIWNLRAALNIAALQCQYLPQLQTVATYNTILRQQGELDDSKTKLSSAREMLKWIGTNSSCLTSRHKAWVCLDKIGKR